jgi:HEAT repeat protein
MRFDIRRHVVTMALLGVGPSCSMIEQAGLKALRKGSESLHKRNLTELADGVDDLKRSLEEEIERRRTLEELEAIRVKGDPEALAKIAPHLVSTVTGVRLAAVEALRADRSPEASAALAERLATDEATPVRAAAGRLLARRPTDASFAAACVAVSADPAVEVRRAIVLELMRPGQPLELVRDHLAKVASSDPEPSMRALAAGRPGPTPEVVR